MRVPPDRSVCRFGSFVLDAARRRLTKNHENVYVPDREMDVLLLLTANAGRPVTKDTIVSAAWKGEAVTDDCVTKAVSRLRRRLGTPDGADGYIETIKRCGYRFTATVRPDESAPTALGPEILSVPLEPYEAVVEGRAALERLDHDGAGVAEHAFADALRLSPGFAAAHIGIANALFLRFESTRADSARDTDALQRAEHHARESCRLDPGSADAWSTFAMVRYRFGASTEAMAAARKAVELEPLEWRHQLRLAFVSWGGERLRAALRVLSLCPGQALAHWLAATVFVARGALDLATDHLVAGSAVQDFALNGASRFAAVGLHLLNGLLLAARGDEAGARAQLQNELLVERTGHIYARESCANAHYALGALHLRARRLELARAEFEEAIRLVPGHPLAVVGLAAATHTAALVPHLNGRDPIDQATIRAAVLALNGEHAQAAQSFVNALRQAPSGQAGWLIPVEPLLNVGAHIDAWQPALAALHSRAS